MPYSRGGRGCAMMGPMPQQPPTSQSPGLHAGVDIGGTKVAVCLADPAHGSGPPVLLTRVAEPTAKTGAPDALAQQVLRLLDAACTQQGIMRSDLAGVGVASCGPFVRHAGMVEVVNPNICGGLAGAPRGLGNDWTRVPLQAPLAQALGAEGALIELDDRGAVDCTIRARVETALLRAKGEEA